MRGCEGFLKGPWREQERAGERERESESESESESEREREREREGKKERETVARSIRGVPEQLYVSLSTLANFCFPETEIQMSDRLWKSKFLLRSHERALADLRPPDLIQNGDQSS